MIHLRGKQYRGLYGELLVLVPAFVPIQSLPMGSKGGRPYEDYNQDIQDIVGQKILQK